MDPGAESYRRYLLGDKSGLEEIIGLYYDGLILYLNLYVRNLAEAEELAEETLFVLVSKKPAFSGKSSFKTWLYAIGRHTAIRYLHRRSREVSVADMESESGRARVQDAERTILIKERDRNLYRCLSRLKEDYRQVIWLRYYEQMSNKMIAAVMKKSVYSVEHLLKRAKDVLRTELEKEGFPYEES